LRAIRSFLHEKTDLNSFLRLNYDEPAEGCSNMKAGRA